MSEKIRLERDAKDPKIGMVFGRLTILCMHDRHGSRVEKRYLCRCECGNECVVFYRNLSIGHTQSCGCAKKKKTTSLVGRYFCRWYVFDVAPSYLKSFKNKYIIVVERYKCRCSCGTVRDVVRYSLENGSTKSCGCLSREVARRKRPGYKRKARCENLADLPCTLPCT